MRQRCERKLFGVGYHRTGTTTLRECFRILGLRETGFDFDLTEDLLTRGRIEPVLERARGFEAFQDWPWPLCFRELDRRFPGSRFVLTTRESSDKWFASLLDHYAWALGKGPNRFPQMFPLLYGPDFPANRSACIERYERHNHEVRDFFSTSDRFLEVCWEQGDDWAALCGFLELPVPVQSFPKIRWYSDPSPGALAPTRARDRGSC